MKNCNKIMCSNSNTQEMQYLHFSCSINHRRRYFSFCVIAFIYFKIFVTHLDNQLHNEIKQKLSASLI